MVQKSVHFKDFCENLISSGSTVPTVPPLSLDQLTLVDKHQVLQFESKFNNLIKNIGEIPTETKHNEVLQDFRDHLRSVADFARLGPPIRRERAINDCLVQYLRKCLSHEYIYEVMVSPNISI